MKNTYLALSYTCNHKCLCCPLSTYDRLHSELKLEDIMEFIDCKSIDENSYVTISGGEPTLYPDFFKVLEKLTNKGCRICLLTNGSRFNDESFINNFSNSIDMNKMEIVTALHSYSSNLHDFITGVPGSFQTSIISIHNLLDRGFSVSIKVIIHKQNYKDLCQIVDYIQKEFSQKVGIQFCMIDLCGNGKKNYNSFFVHYKDLTPYFEQCLDLLESIYYRNILILETPLCALDPYYWKYISSISEKTSNYYAPNAEMEKNSFCSTYGKFYEECQNCIVQPYCEGCWPSVYQKELLTEMKGEIKNE